MTSPDASDSSLSIGQVARLTAMSASAIRYYERQGLLPRAARTSGRRQYGRAVLDQLRMIKLAKAAGFRLPEIGQMLHGFDANATPSERWRALAPAKRDELNAVIAQVSRMQVLLEMGLDCACSSLDECGLIQDSGRVFAQPK